MYEGVACPVCGGTSWEQTPDEAAQDKYHCTKCNTVLSGKDLESMKAQSGDDSGSRVPQTSGPGNSSPSSPPPPNSYAPPR